MDLQNTGKFFIGSIITFIIIFGLSKVILSSMNDVAKNVVEPESMADEAIAKRIKPVAEVNIGEPPAVETPVVVADAAPAAETGIDNGGAKIVANTCALCHRTGMMSSPKLGNAEDWAPRIEKGMDTLYDHAINGFNMMPARGNNPDLSDEEVKAAVDHIISSAK